MGADAFHVCYGLRWQVNAEDEETIGLLERRREPRQIAARNHQLDCWWGVTIEEGLYFLLVGRLVGGFGWEFKDSMRLDDTEMTLLTERTKTTLREAGFLDAPALHFQFEPDY